MEGLNRNSEKPTNSSSNRITGWRRFKNAISIPKQKNPMNSRLKNAIFSEFVNELHISIIVGYISNLSTTCVFPELPQPLTHPQLERKTRIGPPIKQYLKEVLVVPRLNEFNQTQNRTNRSHFLEAFLSLLLQLLYHKTDQLVDQFQDGIAILEKELRFLLTILGDLSWMLRYSREHHAEFQNLLAECERVANQAGCFVHYLFFSPDRTFEETDEGLDVVLKLAGHLKANLQSCVSSRDWSFKKLGNLVSKLFNFQQHYRCEFKSSNIGIPAYTTPTTSIIDSILILYSLIDDLEDLLTNENDRIAEVKDQVNLLHHELLLLNSSIKDMRSPQPSEIEEVKKPLMRIGGIAHQAEYLITSFLVKDAPLWYVSKRLIYLTHRIKPIRKKLQRITLKYQFEGLKVAEHFSSEVPLHDKRYSKVNDVTVGFEDKTIEILDQLVGGGIQSLQVISILGMPGLGKTTLANKLYNHPSVSDRFDKLIWCVVSQTYKRQSILATVLIHINSELGKEVILGMEEISLVDHIHKTLIGSRYLITLDDIWDPNVFDELVGCFPDDGNGSRILVTSRNKVVAPPNSITHELSFLSDEQCWELLEKKVFGCQTCPPQLQGIGKKISARCCGLPLTVVVIAGILSTMHEEEITWEEVGGSLASYIDREDNSVMQILELSYKHLPDHLKPCFLYFGEFKEDEEISVGELKRLWVAEGFIHKEKNKSAENIAGEYLMELIDKSLVMIVKRRMDGRGAKTCVVHDLLRELCLKKCKEENFLKYWNGDYHTIHEKGHRIRADGDSATFSYCQHVRSFVGDRLSNSFYVRDMKVLRVLHFNSIYGREIRIFGIEYLVNLRFLVIQNLPTWIERLVNLEYLRIVLEWETVYLPPTIVKMKKLRYLRAPYAEYGEDWIISNQTNNLQYLSNVTIKTAKDEELLKCSPHLRKLKCNYYQKGMEKSAYPHFDLRFLTQLDSLTLIFSPPLYLVELEDFGFPSNIRQLMLDGSGLPWEKMSIVGRLEFLEVLRLYDDAFQGERWDTRDDEFQNLRFLQLQNMKLREWNVASTEHFSKLRQLILSACLNLEEIPSEIGEISTLELIQVKLGCQNSLVESAERIKEELQDMGNEELRVIISKLR